MSLLRCCEQRELPGQVPHDAAGVDARAGASSTAAGAAALAVVMQSQEPRRLP